MSMLRLASVGLFMLLGIPPFAHAGACEDLWFSRNATFHGAGQCLTSPLGQAMFGADACSTIPRDLTAAEQVLIDLIKETEREFECAIDTSQSTLAGFDDEHRRQQRIDLEFQPLSGDIEMLQWACLDYQGAGLPIYAGPNTGAKVLGYLAAGDRFGQNHRAWGEWQFMRVWKADDTSLYGWTEFGKSKRGAAFFEDCEGMAG